MNSILQMISELTLADKYLVISQIKGLIMADLSQASNNTCLHECPRCKSKDIIKKGRDKTGKQRYKCKACQKTFCVSTSRVICNSKLRPIQWALYVDSMLAKKSLRACANRAKVSLKTSWYMRIRICEVMRDKLKPMHHGTSITTQIDGTYVNESFTGKHIIPRSAHKNGESVHTRGLSKEKVCILCAINDRSETYVSAIGRAKPTSKILTRSLAGIVEGSWVTTDDLASYTSALKVLGVGEHIRVKSDETRLGELGLINALHQRLKDFLRGFHGVSTKWLNHYLWFFQWIEQVRYTEADSTQILSRHTATGTYTIRRSLLKTLPKTFQ